MKKILSLFLCLCMLLSLGSIAFAAESSQTESVSPSFFDVSAANEETDTVNYVALGDSTAMGYYMNDYSDSHPRNTNDKNISSIYSEYAQFKSYLEDTGKQVNATDLTLPGMRPAELRAILDSNYYHSAIEEKQEDSNAQKYLGWYYDYYDSYFNIHNTFTDAIETADVITCDMLSGDFGLYFTDRLSELLSDGFQDSDYQSEYEALMRREGYPALAGSVAALRNSLSTILTEMGLADNELVDTFDTLVDLLLYCYAHCVINFSKTMDLIYGLKKDVNLIIVGPYNPLTRLVGTYHGIEISIGKLWDCLSEAITAYVVKVDPHADQYCFADCSAGVNSFIDDFAEGHFLDDEYDSYRNMFFFYTGIDPNKFASPTDRIQFNQNMQEICNMPVEVENLLTVFSLKPEELQIEYQKAALANTTYNGIAYGESFAISKIALLYSLVTQARSCGYHPGASGNQQKAHYIIKAYERGDTADNAYCIRVADLAKTLAVNYIGSVLGCETSRETLQTVLTHLFTPMIRINILNL